MAGLELFSDLTFMCDVIHLFPHMWRHTVRTEYYGQNKFETKKSKIDVKFYDKIEYIFKGILIVYIFGPQIAINFFRLKFIIYIST
jgi:hypothetical protein